MKTVLAHGVFDLLHSGHVAHLRQCRSYGDKLWISVIADKFVTKRRPLICPQEERVFMLESLKFVDGVILCTAPGPQDVLNMLRPDIYARNDEYLAQDRPEYKLCKELGIDVVFTRTVGPHTSDLIKRIRRHV